MEKITKSYIVVWQYIIIVIPTRIYSTPFSRSTDVFSNIIEVFIIILSLIFYPKKCFMDFLLVSKTSNKVQQHVNNIIYLKKNTSQRYTFDMFKNELTLPENTQKNLKIELGNRKSKVAADSLKDIKRQCKQYFA